MQYLFYILFVPFLYFNYKIIISDIKYKIIPNKYLLYLLYLIPFWWLYLLIRPISGIELGINETGLILFIGQIFLTFIISFILYSFGIWAAGDAKYLLVLSLFIPYIGVIPFIGNIALLTITYLLLYFIWFYLGKCIFYKGYAKSLLGNIKNDLNDKWNNYKTNKGGKTFFIILKWIVIFLIIFVSIRLARIYLFNKFLNGNNTIFNLIQDIYEKYHFYLIVLLFIIILLFIFWIKTLFYILKEEINNINKLFYNKSTILLNIINNLFIILLFIILLSFIVYEYKLRPNEILKYIYIIFTIYISVWIIIKILIYSYKITFQISEQEYINIKNLKAGDIVDKYYLINLLGNQEYLGISCVYENTKGILSPNPKNYFTHLKNPISKKDCSIIKKSYIILNKYSKKNITLYKKYTLIKTLKTFSFGGYIFIGFIITYIFSNNIINYIIISGINVLKKYI